MKKKHGFSPNCKTDEMALIGRVDEFKQSLEDFASYLERFEIWLLANEIKDEKKVSVFLACIGPETYGLLKNLVMPNQPSGLTYRVLTDALKSHYQPKPLVIAERFRFQKRDQKDGESVTDYLVAIRKLSKYCEYGTHLDEALRDRLVSGLASESIQRKLLAEKGLTFARTCEIALAMEMASKNSLEILAKSQNAAVNEVSKSKFGSKGKWQFRSGNESTNQKFEQTRDSEQRCYRCGGGRHSPQECRFKNEKCHSCSKTGHISRVCRNKRQTARAQYVDTEDQSVDGEDDPFGVFTVYMASSGDGGIKVNVKVGDEDISMQLDTGAAVSIASEVLHQKKFPHLPIEKSNIRLKAYSGETIPLLGYVQAPVQYGDQKATMPLIIVKGNRPALFGRNWLEKLKLDWKNIFTLGKETKHGDPELQAVLQRHSQVFSEEVSAIEDFRATIRMQPGAQPVFCKARPVPYSLKEAVEKELDRMEKEGIVSKVDRSQWGAPIVVVPKADKSIRICGDYKVTINSQLEVETYPLPNTEDLFATLAGGKWFSKLDLSHAYQQLRLDKDSEQYLTINTHRGLYRYHRLSYGVASAPSIFQSVMDQILQGQEGVTCFLDDILITANTKALHLKRLEAVLGCLARYGLRAKLAKCRFLQTSVEYLGHQIDHEGLHPTQQKVEAIVNAPNPTNVSELRSYLGLLNYYGRFLKSLSSVLQPLHALLKREEKWSWTPACEEAFKKGKEMLLSSTVLVHYDTEKPLRLACDASPYGVGAVISHVMENGEERPIAFASRTLTDAEKNYAQIEKEALAIIYGVRKFHKYLYGRKFTLFTDHKPLLAILGPKSAVPTLAALRMQRWALILMAYSYELEYKKSADHFNADAMSRLPVTESDKTAQESNIFYFSHVEDLPISAHDIKVGTSRDPLLSKVWSNTMNGWPNYMNDESLKPYFVRRHELSADQGCVLWGLRVIVPQMHRQQILKDLHHEHPGICKMKALARSYLWWPGLDGEIENMVQNCAVCQAVQKVPAVAPLHPWRWPVRVWQRIHLDFAEKDRQSFLVVVDSHSKWLEVFHMTSTTSSRTIEVLRNLFAAHGLPEEVVSDNGPQFASSEFKQFLAKNGIKQTLVPPYHPASNGAAERSVQILKRALVKQVLEASGQPSITLQHRLSNFLLMYRVTPHTVTGRSPAELFLKREIRTRFSLLRPDLSHTVEHKQAKQKLYHDKERLKLREFQENDQVRVKNFRGGDEKWTAATVIKRLGPVTYLVWEGHRQRSVHVDHMLGRRGELKNLEPYTHEDQDLTPVVSPALDSTSTSGEKPPDADTSEKAIRLSPAVPGNAIPPSPSSVSPPAVPSGVPHRRHPERLRSAPKRLDL